MAIDATGSVLLRCMAAVAGADGTVGEPELAAIGEVYREMTGDEVPLDELREIVEAGWNGGPDPVGFVSTVGAAADTETRLRIAEGCYRVLTADGEITGEEAHTFTAVVNGLGLTRTDVLARL